MNRISVSDALRTGWKLTKENFIITIGLVLAYTVVSMLLGLGGDTFVGYILQLLNIALAIIWSMGIIRLTVNAVDGEEPRFEVFKEVLPRFLSFLFMGIVMVVLILIPTVIIMLVLVSITGVSLDTLSTNNLAAWSSTWWIALVSMLPALYLSIRFFFAQYLLIDRNMGAIDSLKASWKASAPLQGKIFLCMIALGLIMLLGVLCFFVGCFVAMVIALYAQAALYRQAFSAGIQDPLLVEDASIATNVE